MTSENDLIEKSSAFDKSSIREFSPVVLIVTNPDELSEKGISFRLDAGRLIVESNIFARDGNIQLHVASADGGINLGTSNALDSGSCFLSCKKVVILETKESRVEAKAGSKILVVKRNDNVCIYNLADREKASVAISCQSHRVELAPGQGLQIAQTTSFRSNKIATRLIREITLSSHKLALFDFSLVSALINDDLLVAARQCRAAKAAVNEVFKMYACLQHVKKGGYVWAGMQK